MGKVNLKSGKKNQHGVKTSKRLIHKEHANSWAKNIAPQGRRVYSDAKKFVSSLKRLIRCSLQSVVKQCYSLLDSAKKQVCAVREKFFSRSRRFLSATRKSYQNISHRSHRVVRTAKRHMRKTGKEGVRQSHRFFIVMCKSYKNFVGYYKKRLSGTKQQILNTRLNVLKHWRRVLIFSRHVEREKQRFVAATRQIYKNFILQCREKARSIRDQMHSFGFTTIKQCQKLFLDTRRIYRNYLKRWKAGVKSRKQQIHALGMKVVGQYRKTLVLTWRAYKNLVSSQRRLIKAIEVSWTTILKGIEQCYKNWVRQSRQVLTSIRKKISTSALRIITNYHRALATAKNHVDVFSLRTARKYLRFLVSIRRTHRSFIKGWSQGVDSAKEQLHTTSLRAARKYLRFLVSIRRTHRSFIKGWSQGVDSAKEQLHTTSLRAARKYLRFLVSIRRTYRSFIKGWSQGVDSAKEQLHTTSLRTARQYLKVLVGLRQSYRYFVRESRRGLIEKSEQISVFEKKMERKFQRARSVIKKTHQNLERESQSHVEREQSSSFWKRAQRRYLRVLVLIRRMQRKFVSLSRQTLHAARNWISSLSQSMASWVGKWQFQKVPLSLSRAKRDKISPYKMGDTMDKMSSWAGPFKGFKSVFSDMNVRLRYKGRYKILKIYNLKQWVNLFLIILFALYLLVITYLIVGKYRSGGSTLATGNKSSPSYSSSAIHTPPLAMIGYTPGTKPVNNSENPSGYSFWPKRFTLRHVQGWGAGIGYGTDYTTAALLIAPDYRIGHVMPMLDLRGHRFDNNSLAANIGIAGRFIPRSNTFCEILGLNAFYDYRRGWKGDYQQIGLGLEILGKRWDLRANGYVPVGVKVRKTKCVFNNFIGNYYAIHRQCEFTSYGYNAEVGYYVVRTPEFFLYAAAGPYYLGRKHHRNTSGGEFRVRPQYKDYLALDLSVSHDAAFGTVYQAQVILYLPLYQLSNHLNKRPCNLTDQQIYQPIERFEVMPLGRRCCWQSNF